MNNLNNGKISGTNFYDEIDADVFHYHIELIKSKIAYIVINGEKIFLTEIGDRTQLNPFLDLKNTLVVSNHRYIIWDPLVLMILSSYSSQIDSVIRPVIGDNLMPNSRYLDYIYYLLLSYCGSKISSKSSNDLFYKMGVIKKKRKLSIEDNSIFLKDMSSILGDNGNIWISGSSGRSKDDKMKTYRNLTRLSNITNFYIIPVNLSYDQDIYPETNNRKKSFLPKSILDILDIFQEARATNLGINLKVGETRPFNDYSKEEIENIIFQS